VTYFAISTQISLSKQTDGRTERQGAYWAPAETCNDADAADAVSRLLLAMQTNVVRCETATHCSVDTASWHLLDEWKTSAVTETRRSQSGVEKQLAAAVRATDSLAAVMD